MTHSMDPDKAFGSLVELIKRNSPACVAFSGGVDSSVVALAAHRASGGSIAVTAVSELCTEEEAAEARLICDNIGIEHRLIHVDLLKDGRLAGNPPERCYICKKAIISAIRNTAERLSIPYLMDGSNADDASAHRPGMKALGEAGVISPLAELGMAKPLVREIALSQGLPNHDKPSAPCLATRFPYGTRLTVPGLARVRQAEEFIRSLGFAEFRVRDHGEIARIELLPDDLERVMTEGLYKIIVANLTALGYNYVTLDLQGFRSGSMDEPL